MAHGYLRVVQDKVAEAIHGEECVLPVEIERESLEVIKKRTAHYNEKITQLAMAEEEKEESLAHQKDEDLS